MLLFGKKKEEENKVEGVKEIKDRGIYVLGSGCKKCNDLARNMEKALKALGLDEEVFHVTDFALIASTGIMSTPGLIIDKKLLSYGQTLSEEECLALLKKAGRIHN